MKLEDVKALAELLLEQHGLADWQFELNNAKRRFGFCRHSAKLISTSKHLAEVNEEPVIQKHLLHEIAHALVGIGHGHDYAWRRKAIEIGDDGARCYTAEEQGGDVKTVDAPYQAICPKCGKIFKKFRRPRSGLRHACPFCCKQYNFGHFTPDFLLVYNRI